PQCRPLAWHGPPLLALLRAVARPGLLAVPDTGGVEGPPDDLVPDPGHVLHAAAADQHDGVLLKVVADPRDIGSDLYARSQPDPRHLPQGRVRLLGRGRVDARTDAAALRRPAKSGALRLAPRALAPGLDQLLDGGHSSSVCNAR